MFILDFFLLFYKIFSAENHGFFSISPGYFCHFSGLSVIFIIPLFIPEFSLIFVIFQAYHHRWQWYQHPGGGGGLCRKIRWTYSFSFFIAKICCFRNIFHKPLLPLNNTPLIHKLKQFGISFFHFFFLTVKRYAKQAQDEIGFEVRYRQYKGVK